MTVATSFCRRVHWAEIHETTRPRSGRTNGASTAPPMSSSSAATSTTPRGQGRRWVLTAGWLPRGIDRFESVTEWLRRAGAGRLLIARGQSQVTVRLTRPPRGRVAWRQLPVKRCDQCDREAPRRSPGQRHCSDCAARLRRERSRASRL